MTTIVPTSLPPLQAPAPPPKPATLDPHLVVLAAQVAYDMGILTQQGPDPRPAYRDETGRPDAIGVSLPPEFALYYNTLPVPALPLDPPLDLVDLIRLSHLQIASDRWSRDRSNPHAEQAFRDTLDQLRKEYARDRHHHPASPPGPPPGSRHNPVPEPDPRSS